MPFNPDWSAIRSAATGPVQGVMYNALTGQQTVAPANIGVALGAASGSGGGYRGVDGGLGSEVLPASMGGMTLLSAATRGLFPYRMNVKLLMRFGSSYYVCSGSMRDANVVLTAGHCVNDGGGGAWADEIWVYPAWDGNGSLFGPPSTVNPFGWAHSTSMASATGWTVSGDFNYDIGAVAIDRAAGFLTGWFGWAYGNTCAFAVTTAYRSGSYPAENCSDTLHTGADMYFWNGSFDFCPNTNRVGLLTASGCLGAVWGGMSGSGAYYLDAGSNRVTHAVTSTSNRFNYAEYTRQWQGWVDYLNDIFDPVNAQGPNFNLQPLNVAGASAVTAGQTLTGLTHVAANTSRASRNANYSFKVYLSSNNDVATSDTFLSGQVYNWNFAGVSAATIAMAPVTIPANTPPGTYYLGVIYDNATDGNTMDNDSDGWDALRIAVVAGGIADLSVSALLGPATANPGANIIMSNTVANNGNALSGPFRLGLYLSGDNVCTTGDTLIGSRGLNVAAGGSSTLYTLVSIPVGAALGPMFICAIADDFGAVGESNEGNNTRSTPIGILSAVPTVTLKVNGLHPTPPNVISTGPYNLTISIAPTTMTATLDAYWAMVVNGTLYWITSTGVSTTPAPFMHAPPPVWTNLSLVNTTLPHGVSVTAAYFLINGSTVVSSDFITATVPER